MRTSCRERAILTMSLRWMFAGTKARGPRKPVKRCREDESDFLGMFQEAFPSVGGRRQTSVVAFASPNLQTLTLFLGGDADGAIVSIRLEIGGLIGDEVTAADQIVQLIEGLAQSQDIAGKHPLSSSALGQHL